MNKNPWWKDLLIVLVVVVAAVYALPNIYAPDPAIQISGESSAEVIDDAVLQRVEKALQDQGISHIGTELGGNRVLVRFQDPELQLRGKTVVQRALGDGYVVALNLAATTPDWLVSLGAEPMKLGLDLSGGVHFLLQVDTEAMVHSRLDNMLTDIRRAFRKDNVRANVYLEENHIIAEFDSAEERAAGVTILTNQFPELTSNPGGGGGRAARFKVKKVELALQGEMVDGKYLTAVTLPDQVVQEIQDYAVRQNLTTLRNRVNELGVAEPLVQRQGRDRIVVELPGIQDTAAAKRILGKTASLEFRLEADMQDAAFTREQLSSRNGQYGEPWVEKKVIVTGERVANAQSGFDENGRPQVSITLDSQGGTMMHRTTRHNVKNRMAVVFIERKSRTVGYEKDEAGNEVPIRESYDTREVINLATIQTALGSQFRITGLDTSAEAAELALLLRAGALAAPLDFVEERTVGPSLGRENIDKGMLAAQVGLALVVAFMVIVYKVFGIIATIALASTVMLLIAAMSMLSATLTMPGIAGIVLTLGMAVDANVLIFSRIREELKNRLTPQQAISEGFDRAFTTIFDSNLTTLIVGVILYAVGTGPVKGFAVTLSLGILTSMFSALLVTRMIINWCYGGRKVSKLWI